MHYYLFITSSRKSLKFEIQFKFNKNSIFANFHDFEANFYRTSWRFIENRLHRIICINIKNDLISEEKIFVVMCRSPNRFKKPKKIFWIVIFLMKTINKFLKNTLYVNLYQVWYWMFALFLKTTIPNEKIFLYFFQKICNFLKSKNFYRTSWRN